MKRIFNIIKNPLFWIFLIALILRTYKLDELPFGFHVDEVKVAWNALSIAKTGLTDQNKSLGLYYDSFGDFRPSGIFFLTIPFISFLPRTEFAVRLPIAFIGALTVLPIYFLVKLINEDVNQDKENKNDKKQKNKMTTKIAYIASFLLAISPWHIELSRATNEMVVSTFFVLFAIICLIKLNKSKKIYFGLLTILLTSLSYLFYHSIRLLGPLVLTATYILTLNNLNPKGKNTRNTKDKKIDILGTFCILFSLMLTIFFATDQKGLSRLGQTSITNDVDISYQIERIKLESANIKGNILTKVFDSKNFIYLKSLAIEYGKYFSTDFLIGDSGRPYRFTTPGVGLITYVELLLLILGLSQIVKEKKNILPIILLLLAPIPAAITIEDSPNISRAFLMLPFLISIEALGFENILSSTLKFKKQITIIISILLIANFSYFLHMYFNHSISHRPYIKNFFVDSPTYRNVGTKELALKLDSLKGKYDKIIVTSFPDSPYPWYAFLNDKNPSEINKTYSENTKERVYENIIFSEDKCPSDYALLEYRRQNILIIEPWECPYKSKISDGEPLKIVDQIKRPDGSEVCTFMERDWTKPLLIDNKEVWY